MSTYCPHCRQSMPGYLGLGFEEADAFIDALVIAGEFETRESALCNTVGHATLYSPAFEARYRLGRIRRIRWQRENSNPLTIEGVLIGEAQYQ